MTLLEIRRRSASLLQLQILKSTKLRSPSLLLQMLYIRQINDDRAADSTYFKWALSTVAHLHNACLVSACAGAEGPRLLCPMWLMKKPGQLVI